MTKVRVIISTIRYGSNGFKHMGDVFNLPEATAKDKESRGLVEIIADEVVKDPQLTKSEKSKKD